MKKLVVWDEAWLPSVSEFERLLGSEWGVVGGSGLPWLLDEIGDTDALVATTMPAEALASAQSLQLMLYPGAGCTHIMPEDLPEGCLLANVYEHEGPMAEYVMMMMLMHATGVLAHMSSLREGRWEGSGRTGGEPHVEVDGRVLGMFGFGHIGRAVAKRAEAFGMRVEAVTRSRGSLMDMLPRCDFFLIAAPLTGETRGRIGAAELALLPRHAFLINVGRAEIVCEGALYDALESKAIAGAALDVWYQYPGPGERGHGSRFPFHTLPNVMCTPHYSAWTRPMILRRIALMAENLQRLARGEAIERVVLEGTWRG